MNREIKTSLWSYHEGRSQTVLHASEIETVKPLDTAGFYKLLEKKPVSDWGKITEFLVQRNLVFFPRAEHFPVPPVTRASAEVAVINEAARNSRALAHRRRTEEQKVAAEKRRETRKAAHEKMVAEQKLAAERRKLAKAKQQESREQAARSRKVKAITTEKVEVLRTGGQVRHYVSASTEALLNTIVDAESRVLVRDQFNSLPPVFFKRVDGRSVRPIIPLEFPGDSALGEQSKKSLNAVFNRLQVIIRSSERHLSELFHEDGKGWQEVVRRRAVKGSRA